MSGEFVKLANSLFAGIDTDLDWNLRRIGCSSSDIDQLAKEATFKGVDLWSLVDHVDGVSPLSKFAGKEKLAFKGLKGTLDFFKNWGKNSKQVIGDLAKHSDVPTKWTTAMNPAKLEKAFSEYKSVVSKFGSGSPEYKAALTKLNGVKAEAQNAHIYSNKWLKHKAPKKSGDINRPQPVKGSDPGFQNARPDEGRLIGAPRSAEESIFADPNLKIDGQSLPPTNFFTDLVERYPIGTPVAIGIGGAAAGIGGYQMAHNDGIFG